MATYVILVNFTQKGIENVKESPKRLDDVKRAFKSMGAELKAFYLVVGRYDVVMVAESPSDEITAKLALSIASKGYVRTETLRAFNEEEYRSIINALP